ncbi:MAG: LysE family translocator [Rhodobacteraceae bacterium]|nr:LysE family translocator [Paracoccaceae bacterium]
MSTDLLLALILYAFVASITPGPNNLMLLASGANFGFRRTLPHMLGIGGGFTVMVALVGLGLAGLFVTYPPARLVLTVLSVLYLLWLSWKIATAAPPDRQATVATKPFSFLQAAAFQWVNPKAWTMALTANTLYAPAADLPSVLAVALAFGAVNLPCVSVWAAMGTVLRRILRTPTGLRLFNGAMALLLVATLWPVLRT